MEPIQKNFTKEDKIEDGYEYKFDVMEEGLYLIEIIASAKSWWQNFLKIRLGDDDLTVKVDGIEFPKLNGKKGLFDGEVAWNGNNLKGLNKTNVFISKLTKGEHALHFLVDKNPILKSVKIKKVDSNEINYIPDSNNPAEDGNRRQWMSVILVDLPLKQLAIEASCKKYSYPDDDDDLKLIIDEKIQADPKDKNHYFSFWCGAVDEGAKKEFSKELNLEKGLHYIELWADRMPEISGIILNLGLENEPNNGDDGKRIPTVDDPEWTGNFNDDTEQMILARALWGEARSESREARIAVAWSVKNRLGTKEKWDSYHHILLDSSQYSCFWEEPPKDPNLQALRSPLKTTDNPDDHAKWEETYTISGQVIEGKISDPISGSNSYYDDSIWKRPASQIPNWIKDGKVVLKIGRLNFLYVK